MAHDPFTSLLPAGAGASRTVVQAVRWCLPRRWWVARPRAPIPARTAAAIQPGAAVPAPGPLGPERRTAPGRRPRQHECSRRHAGGRGGQAGAAGGRQAGAGGAAGGAGGAAGGVGGGAGGDAASLHGDNAAGGAAGSAARRAGAGWCRRGWWGRRRGRTRWHGVTQRRRFGCRRRRWLVQQRPQRWRWRGGRPGVLAPAGPTERTGLARAPQVGGAQALAVMRWLALVAPAEAVMHWAASRVVTAAALAQAAVVRAAASLGQVATTIP